MSAPSTSPRLFRFGLYEADAGRRTLTRSGIPVKIQDQPFRVLLSLLERPSTLVTREELRQILWPDGTYVDFDGSLNVILKKLRATLNDDPDNPRFIETVPRRGYRFIAPVSPVSDPPALASSVPVATPSSARQPQAPQIRMRWLLAALTAVLIVTIVLRIAEHRHTISAPTVTASPPLHVRQSVAVLGFRNTSHRPTDDWLANAFSEMLSTELASGETLRLVSEEDVANLRRAAPWSEVDTLDKQTTARLGTSLNSDLLVLGSYTALADPIHPQVRMDVRLQDAHSGEILTEVADTGTTQDLFHIVERVGGKLRDRLGVPRLQEADETRVAASLPANYEAARLYSLGIAQLRDNDNLAARDLFEQTTKADPKFALAYSMLSRADNGLGHDDLSKSEAKRGLALAANLAPVQRMEIEASYDQAIADRAKAAEIYRTLFNLYPDSLDYGLQLSKLQLESYHPDEALATLHQLRNLPSPARDSAAIDLREGMTVFNRDAEAALRLYRSAADKAQAQGKTLIYARAEGSLCYLNPQRLPSPPECQRAYDAFLAAGNRAQAGNCIQLMAEAQRQTGHPSQSIPLYHQALDLFRQVGDREMLGVTLNNLSLVLGERGAWQEAERNYREAGKNFTAVHDLANTASADSNIGDILLLRGHLAEAAGFYRQAWEAAAASQRARPEGMHVQFAALLLLRGELQQARTEAQAQVASLRQYNGEREQLASVLTTLGNIDAEDNPDQSRKDYEEALKILQELKSGTAGTDIALADLDTATGHPDQAIKVLRPLLAAAEKENVVSDRINAGTSLARALLAKGDSAAARQEIDHALHLVNLQPYPTLRIPLAILDARARAANSSRDSAAALTQLRNTTAEAKQFGAYLLALQSRLAELEISAQFNPQTVRAQLESLTHDARAHGFTQLAARAEKMTPH